MIPYPKRLIEVDLPIKKISAHARREKSIRHGHISTLHIWWARRPLAACRAVICAALWPDPVDASCPQAFRNAAATILADFAEQVRNDAQVAGLVAGHWQRWRRTNAATFPRSPSPSEGEGRGGGETPSVLYADMREALLDFIADFANWDASTVPAFLNTARALTQAAHESLGGLPGTRPLVVDPFAGGGAIPLEALRVGADAFASDLNPVAVLLNKVVLEYIPKYGQRLADEVRKWGQWIKEQAEKELAEFYPKDPDGATPIAYLWARTIQCEGPSCGVRYPLIRQPIIGYSKGKKTAIVLKDAGPSRPVKCVLEEVREVKSSCRGFVGTCPRPSCGYSTPKKSVQAQLTSQKGGTDTSMLLAVVTDSSQGRAYRLPTSQDFDALEAAKITLMKKVETTEYTKLSLIPDEPIPSKTSHRAVGSQLPLYGFRTWGDLFTIRQKLALIILQDNVRKCFYEIIKNGDEPLARVVVTLLAFALDKQADYSSSLCRWVSGGGFIAATLGGEKKLPMLSDFAEANPIGSASGSWMNHIDWIARFLEREASTTLRAGIALKGSADEQLLPNDAAAAMITDPPYYDSVPYSDLSDFFYVWLHRTLNGIGEEFSNSLTPKDREMTVNHPHDTEQIKRYEELLTNAFSTGRHTTDPLGIGMIVFAHKSTSGWEALLEAIVQSGWIVTASWPVDTERGVRMNALDTASLNSSVHIVCRPRENPDGSLSTDEVGDWRDVLQELPPRIHAWLPRLAQEGVVGADAIFACLGPALEIFSRYSRVEKASGEPVLLKEYLEQVWAAVSKEALGMVFAGADASALEEDARLTAMWLWTLSRKDEGGGLKDEAEDEEGDEETGGSSSLQPSSFSLEYDAARKIAQGLGAYLEKLDHLVEIKGSTARLRAVSERTRYLFGQDGVEAASRPVRKRQQQMSLFDKDEGGGLKDESVRLNDDFDSSFILHPSSFTILDRVHQSMLLFAAGRSDALKRFLVDEGVGQNTRFWQLANALSALYPPGTDEKRWVEGVLARKKGLGF